MKSGRLLATQTQYERWSPEQRALFTPVYFPASGNTLYRFTKGASTHPEYKPKPVDPSSLNPNYMHFNDMHKHFTMLVDAFCNELVQPYDLKQVEADEDEEFSYHAFCTAVITVGMCEEDWLFEKLYGNMYVIRNIERELNDQSDAE